jgi:hypothetical protein
MADVSVEFGAKDVGLEQTLKTVQDQLAKLEDEVKSGTLSFDELQQTMRKVAQAEKMQEQLQAIGGAVKETGEQATKTSGMFDESFTKIAGAFTVGNIAAQAFEKIVGAAFSAARAVVDGFAQAIDLGGRLDDLSKRTGETAGNLFILEGAFKEAGLSADQVGTTINKLQNFMQDAANGGERQTATMNKLGISLEQLAGRTPTQQMEIFAQKIAGIQDPTQRAATASEVFGEKLGGKLLPLLLEFPKTLDNVRDRTGGMADVMDKSAATFAKAGDTIDAVKGKLTAFAAGVLSEVIPRLEEMGTAMEQVDATSLGQEIGSILNPALAELNTLLINGLKEYREYAKITHEAGLGTTETADAAEKATGMLDLLGVMVSSVVGPITDLATGTSNYRDAQNAAAEAAKKGIPAIEQVGTAASTAATNLTGAADATNNLGTSLLTLSGDGSGLLSGISGSAGELNVAFGEIDTTLGESNVKLSEQLAIMTEQIAAEEARNQKIAERQENSAADYARQLAINEALASGNTDKARALEYERELSKLTEKIMQDTGMSQESAEAFAEKLLASKDAAEQAAGKVKKIKDGVGDANNESGKFKSFVEYIKEQNLGESIKPLSEKTRDARKEIEAFGQYIGKDLRQMSFPDIADELNINTIGMTGSEQIDAIVSHIKSQLPNAKINPVDESESKKSVDNVAGYMKDEFKTNADVGFATGEGQKILSGISTLVSDLKTIVQSLSDKLPMQALA